MADRLCIGVELAQRLPHDQDQFRAYRGKKMNRPQPLSDQDWPEAAQEMLSGFAGKLNVYRVMAHHPDLLKAWAPLRTHLVTQSALGPERSEVVILRVASRFGSEYEWAHHVSRARKLGFSDARIAALQKMPDGEDGLIARAVDSLIDARKLTPELDSALAEAIGRHAVFDLIATVGFYSVLGYILMSFDTPIDAAIVDEMARAPLGTL
jgi:4-carboxymuconolactone decarboxylase